MHVNLGAGDTLAYDASGRALACAGLRAIDTHDAEIKRMYVRPEARRRGVGRVLLAALANAARRERYNRLVLETGHLQPEATALYRAGGFQPIRCFGPYIDSPNSRCWARAL